MVVFGNRLEYIGMSQANHIYCGLYKTDNTKLAVIAFGVTNDNLLVSSIGNRMVEKCQCL